MSIMIKLSVLDFGHNAVPPINARRVGREDGIEGYAASIAAHGLIQALNVRKIDGRWYVADGNKRLAAMRLRAERGEIAADTEVKCDETAASGDAEELSVAANFIRAPLHEADTYETFRDLEQRGLTQDEIASRFGIEVPRVRKMLALGHLSPLVLQAWRDGEFGRGEVECVRAFTLARSEAEQERVYTKLKKDGQLYSNMIRRELGADDSAARKFLKTVGVEAYVAAGGTLVEDLFGDNHVIYDVKLAERLAADRMIAELERLAAEGWSWAALEDNVPSNWSYSWERLTAAKDTPTRAEKHRLKALQLIVERPGGSIGEKGEAAQAEIDEINAAIKGRTWNDDQKAKAGAVVSVDHYGELEITCGVMKPAAAKKAEPAPANGKAEKKPSVLSNALHQRLSVQATLATRAALQQEPRVGLVALLAGFMAPIHDWNPIRVSHQGFGKSHNDDPEKFADAFVRLSSMSDQELFKIAAGIASEAINLERGSVGRNPFDENSAALAAAINPEHMSTALHETFDAADYFGGAAKPFVLQAIREAVNDDEARKAEKLKKAELVEYALQNVEPTGWLPPELRPTTYTGPGAAL